MNTVNYARLGRFNGLIITCSALDSVGGLLPFVAFMGLCFLIKFRRREPPRLNAIPHLNAIFFWQDKALPKKKPLERSEQGRFFLSKPEGFSLGGKKIVQLFVRIKAGEIIYLTHCS